MTDENRKWLQDLHQSIWKETRGLRTVGQGRQESYTYYTESRRLTVEEWDRLAGILQTTTCELVNSGFGFGCAVRVFDETVSPPYPGIPQEVPELLLVVDKNHLPLDGRTEEVPTLKGKVSRPADRTYFEDGWVAFSPHTHSEENVVRLKEAGLPAPRSKGHYEY